MGKGLANVHRITRTLRRTVLTETSAAAIRRTADSSRQHVNDGSPVIEIDHVTKRFDDYIAVSDADFSIGAGEFFSMLGPSGCGKTTTLRMIAGFDTPTEGAIRLEGVDVSRVPPNKRNVNTVFQHYALFPHMTVWDNVAYGPRSRKKDKEQVKKDVDEMIGVVQLTDFALRKPAQLSGGQQQRVALARALVNYPSALLLDEPLGALDLKLRHVMQFELKRIQRELGITFVYVTHDQAEALTMSDRIAVFNGGRIEQVGPPAEVYERPATRFVAGFVGTSNLLSGAVAEAIVGRPGTFTVRPEKIHLNDPDTEPEEDEVDALGRIREVVYIGPDTRYHVALDAGAELIVTRQNIATTSTEALAQQGRAVRLHWKRQHCLPVADGVRPKLEETA